MLLRGRIRLAAGDADTVEAIAVRDGTVVAAGSADAVAAAVSATRVVELGARAVLPAFVDSHTHFHRGAILRHLYLDFDALRPRTVADVLEHVRRRGVESPAGGWIQGDSLSTGRIAERRLPDRHELDVAAPAHPVVLRGIGKHVVAANSAALAAAGITRDTPDPPGGRIERDERGEPTGIVHERGKLRLDTSHPDTVVPAPSPADRVRALEAGVHELHRRGIATIHEMVRLPEEAGDFAALRSEGRLGVRVRLFYRVHESPLSLDWLVKLGIRRGLGDDWLRVVGVKVSVDGWCIFRNAAVYEPYLPEPDNTGILRIEQEELDALVRTANEHGLGIAVHAVGARAVDAALDAFDRAGPAVAGPHRLEHAYLDVDEGQLWRMKRLGLVWSTQPGFLPAYWQDWDAALGPDRADRIMPLRRGHELGIPVVLNSDFPSGPLGTLEIVQAAVTREAAPERRLGADQAISTREALAAVTTTPATITGEPRLGSLRVGSPADLVVLDQDPLDAGAEVAALEVSAMMVEGRFVFDRVGFAA